MLKSIQFFVTLLISCTGLLQAQDNKYGAYQAVSPPRHDSIKCRELLKQAIYAVDSLKEYDAALGMLEKVNAFLNKQENLSLRPKLYYYWGAAFYRKGDYTKADKLFTIALGLKTLEEDQLFKAKILNNAGANLYNMKVFKRAMTNYNNALEIYTRLRDFKGMGAVYWNMSNISSAAGNFKEAERLLNIASKLFLQHNLLEDYGILSGTKSYIKAISGHYDSAIIYNNRGLNIPFKNQLKKPEPFIQMYISQGKNYAEVSLWDSAFYCLNRAKQLFDSLKLSDQFNGKYYFFMGYCNDLKQDHTQALSNYKKALGIKTGVGNYRFIYENMADIYLARKQYDSAFFYKDKAIMFADSLYNSELQEHITFEDKRIQLLEKDYQDQVRSAAKDKSLQQLQTKNYTLVILLLILVVCVLLFFIYFRQYKLKIKKEHLQSELDFLKAQLNPHFLFNSINNIYVLIDENKNKASEILLKFSELMRYQLYECNVKYIRLSKELQFLENYIEFEQLRYSNKIVVEGRIDKAGIEGLMIAPLLLQPFIENAFKHSPKKKNLQSLIGIRTLVTGNVFLLEVTNTIHHEQTSELPGGIGLENVKKRLKLLYQGKYDLTVTKTNELFTITLKLTLSYD
ncbi:MAG: histidine kinase [Bacteroidota bacterium]